MHAIKNLFEKVYPKIYEIFSSSKILNENTWKIREFLGDFFTRFECMYV